MPTVVNSRSASPDFSKIAPIKTKNIIARSVKSDIVPNQRLGSSLIQFMLNMPNAQPINMKTKAVPANENATGYPYRISTKNSMNITIASHSNPIVTPFRVTRAGKETQPATDQQPVVADSNRLARPLLDPQSLLVFRQLFYLFLLTSQHCVKFDQLGDRLQ